MIRSWFLRHWHAPVAVVVLVVVYLNVRSHLPSAHEVGGALATASVGWILVAAGCQGVSLLMFAYQQRHLLGALDVRMSVPRAFAVTCARTALVFGLPAGAAVSAGFAFDQYRRSGATNEKAAAVTVLSAVVSIIGLVSLCLFGVVGMFTIHPGPTFASHPIVLYAAAALVVAGAVTMIVAKARTAAPSQDAPLSRATVSSRSAGASEGGRVRRLLRALRRAVDAARCLRPRDLAIASAFAAGSWLLDALCLAAASAAFRLPVGLFTIAAMYLGIQIVLQLPVTPGGVGLIETGLLAGLTHAGAAAGAAAGVVVTYRVLSCWLILPLGGAAWLALRRRLGTRTVVLAERR